MLDGNDISQDGSRWRSSNDQQGGGSDVYVTSLQPPSERKQIYEKKCDPPCLNVLLGENVGGMLPTRHAVLMGMERCAQQ